MNEQVTQPTMYPKGKVAVVTEPGEAVDVRQIAGSKIRLNNGQSADIERAWTTDALLAATANQAFIPDPESDQFYILVIAFTVMAETAAAVVTPTSDSAQIGMKYPCAMSGGITRHEKPRGYFRSKAGKGIKLTTEGTGTVHADADYITVPIGVDIL